MSAEVRWLINILSLSILSTVLASIGHRKFEYKYSFKPPYLAQKDGSVPFWEYGGNAIASSENVRIAPSLRSQKGAIWTKSKTSFDWWEVELEFRISGRGRVGADGLAFWFTESRGAYDGNVFGSSDHWVGLGIFFDSFDNDAKHNNPYIMAMVNDGTQAYDHLSDGTNGMLAGCLKDFRNKPFPTKARIEYYMNTLTVMFHNGMTHTDEAKDYEICMRADNLHLPKAGYFGVSAATGGLADDHDVLHFLTTSLYPPGTQPPAPSSQAQKLTPEEEVKLTKEYQEYQEKLEAQKQKYREDHPNAKKKDEYQEFEEFFESDSQREFRQILSGQSQIMEQARLLSQKLDEVIGRQERALGLIAGLQQGGIAHQQQIGVQPGVGGAPPVMIDTIRRHEVDAVLANQNNIISQARELRGFLVEIHTKADSLLQKGGGGGGGGGGTDPAILRELREGIGALRQQQQPQISAPSSLVPCPSGVSPLLFFIALAGHLLIMFLYTLYRDSKGAQAKKLF